MKTLVGALVLLAAHASQPISPLEGDWHTDLPPNFRMSSIIAVMSGIGFKVTASTVTVSNRYTSPIGRSIPEAQEVYQTDGKPHQRADEPGSTVAASWPNPSTLDLVFTRKTETIHITYSVSADGHTLTYHWVNPRFSEEKVFTR